MKFQIKDLKKLLLSIENHNVKEVQIKSSKTDITINKNQKVHYLKNNGDNYIHESNNNISNLNIASKSTSPTSELETYSTIISPMVGTFYRSPAPNEPVFVEKNDIVEKKQVVCIIEAMKLMNEIEAEIKGEIVDILVEDGDIVDCGQALMKVRTTL